MNGPGAAPAIVAEAVSKRYRRPHAGAPRRLRTFDLGRGRDESWALRDVSFAVAPGECVGIIGGNGSGKSTLLRVVAGLTRPTAGAVRTSTRVSGLLTLGDSLEPLMTAEENAVTAGILAGLTRREIERRLPEISAFAELDAHMDQPLRTFSDGMRLRLAFAVAVHVDPRILLIDEILAVGDLRFQEKCLQRIEALRDDAVTILLTSHVLAHTRRICHRTVWLQDGVVRLDGPTDEVTQRYENMMREGLPAPEAVPGGGLRIGTGRAEIVAVRVLDAGGSAASRVVGGSPITVELDYRAPVPIEEPVVGVSLHAGGTGAVVMDLDTDADRAPVGTLRGRGTVTLALARLDLPAGSYFVDVGLYGPGWSEVLDYRWEARSLAVDGEPARGALAPPRTWRHRGAEVGR